MSAFHDLKLTALDGQELPLTPYKGQVVLVVNVASKCGLTPQYAALEKLYQQYKGQGFTVLGLPCNQFAGQEPGTEDEIQAFCSLNYGVSFPLGSKLEVNGPDRHQLYRLLAGEGAEFPGDITWNFEKFLLGKDERVLARFSPRPEFPIIFRFSQWKQQDYTARLVQTPEALGEFLKPLSDAGVDIFHCSTRRFWEPEFEGSELNLAGWTRKLTG
eukprot:gene18753-18623_t